MGMEAPRRCSRLATWSVVAAVATLTTSSSASAASPPSSEPASAPTTLFLNFDGPTISRGCGGGGCDDSRTNTSRWSNFAGNYAPYGGDGTKRAAVLQVVRRHWEPFNVRVVDERPESGSYDMCVVSPTRQSGVGNGSYGLAGLDCGNRYDNEIVTAYYGANDRTAVNATAGTISQELAHNFGMEHVNSSRDIMYGSVQWGGPDQVFTDSCLGLSGSSTCSSSHTRFCGSGQQNSHQELLWLIGENRGDDLEPPTVVIVSPRDTEVFDEDASFQVVADANDDLGVASATLHVDGSPQSGALTSPPWSWTVSGPSGMYTFEVSVVDFAGNEAMSDPVTITIDPGSGWDGSSGSGDSGGETEGDPGDEPEGPSSGTGDDDDEPPGGGGDSSGGGDGETGGGDGWGGDADQTGARGRCAVQPDPTAPGWAVLGWVPLLLSRRRSGHP